MINMYTTPQNTGPTKAVFTDVHGPLLETYLHTDVLRRGSLSSLRYLMYHMKSEREPKTIAIVSGESESTLRYLFRRMKIEIEYGTVEHGLGIMLPGRGVLPIHDVDDSYAWLKDLTTQSAEIRRKLLDMPQVVQAYKQFMAAPYVPPNISPEDFRSYVISYMDGVVDLSKFDLRSSHGALDIRPKGVSKRDGVRVLRNVLGLKREEIVGVEDNDFEWLEEVGYACCPTPSSDRTLHYVRDRERNGTGKVLTGDYRDIVIKKVIELI